MITILAIFGNSLNTCQGCTIQVDSLYIIHVLFKYKYSSILPCLV